MWIHIIIFIVIFGGAAAWKAGWLPLDGIADAKSRKLFFLTALAGNILGMALTAGSGAGTVHTSGYRLEKEENARWFGENFPFEPLALEDRLPEGFQVLDGSEGGIVKFQGKTAGLSRQKGCLQLLPGEGPFDGFFISLFKRQE